MGLFSYYKEEAQEPLIKTIEKEQDNPSSFSSSAPKEEVKKKLLKPNKGNGLDMENYSWVQSLEEVTINIQLPRGESENYFTVTIENSNSLKVGRHLQPFIIDGQLFKEIKADKWSWCFSSKEEICFILPKKNKNWWKSLLKDGPEIDTHNFENKWRILTQRVLQPWKRCIFG
ncbi:protein BOBBER 1-like [Nicotiana tabacum]|uniref:Protein BOBBER 1-like n=1 Tax=Nicotiana tabacum TaxID=4097 RepID=A0A1S3XWY9_TOBAC